MESLSLAQARKIILHSQLLPPKQIKQPSKAVTLSAIEQLGYIQIDTISVIQRAHHHTLWNRNARYHPKDLDALLDQKQVFEYWSHAAAYLPMRDYRYSLYRKNAFKTGQLKHWYRKDQTLMDGVLKRIEQEGPLMAKDFEGERANKGGWGGKPAKQALETLFMQGDLMVPKRVNFHKVYDLAERVIPSHIDTSVPSDFEYARYLIVQYLEANGVGLVSEMSYLLKNVKPLLNQTLHQMLEEGEVVEIAIGQQNYYMLPYSFELLKRPLSRSKLKILSPFDNLLIQRKRMTALFDFDYLIECYVPEAKRQYGYFSLPILWQGELVARMDCKVERKKGCLNINNLVLEGKLQQQDAFIEALTLELSHFMAFNQSHYCVVHKTSPSTLRQPLAERLKRLFD
jgi:uncharacterized protein YcaQ